MRRRVFLWVVVVAAAVGVLGWALWPRGAAPLRARLVGAAAPADAAGFARAEGPRALVFPADHGPHDDYQTEWWYYTGNVTAATGEHFGYQLTFFRRALAPPGRRAVRESAWGADQVYMAHLALTDAAGGKHYAFERLARGAAGLAGAQAEPFRVWLEDWEVAELTPTTGLPGIAPSAGLPGIAASAGLPGIAPSAGLPGIAPSVGLPGIAPSAGLSGVEASAGLPGQPARPARLRAAVLDLNLSLNLDLSLADLTGPILQGDRGYSRKGPEPGNASYYVSLPRLATGGTITLNGRTFNVTGLSWMDHEWSTSALGSDQVGWDWFSIQLDDETELMLFRLRRADGRADAFSGGTLIAADGTSRTLAPGDFTLEVTDRWRSPRTAAEYPAGWILSVPSADLRLTLTPWLADQEMALSYAYWEGAVRVAGTRHGQPVAGNGYVELTGYAGSMQNEFQAPDGRIRTPALMSP